MSEKLDRVAKATKELHDALQALDGIEPITHCPNCNHQLDQPASQRVARPPVDPSLEEARKQWVRRGNRARIAVFRAKKRGLIPNLPDGRLCVDCNNNPATIWEHRDYDKPLEVEAVCDWCNRQRGHAKGHHSEAESQ